MAHRAIEVGLLTAAAWGEGIPVGFLTLTLRHNRDQRLAPLWDAVGKSWEKVIGGEAWQKARTEFGIEGVCRVVEVTVGDRGWHPHLHGLVVAHGLTNERELERLCSGMYGRWSRALQRAGLDAPQRVGQDWRLVDGHLEGTALSEYLTKLARGGSGAIGLELTQTQSKRARSAYSTRSTWELLDEASAGEVGPVRLWHEFERASKGRRQIGWSRGLRQRFGIGQELTDEEIAAKELGTKDDTVVWITRAGWDSIMRMPRIVPAMYTVAETSSQEVLSAWLWAQGIDHRKA